MIPTNSGVDTVGKVPSGDNRLRQRTRWSGVAALGQTTLRAKFHGFDFGPAECTVADSRAINFSVVLTRNDYP